MSICAYVQFSTIETRGELEPKCILQLFLGLLLGMLLSAIGQYFFPAPSNSEPEQLGEVNSAQFFFLFLIKSGLKLF